MSEKEPAPPVQDPPPKSPTAEDYDSDPGYEDLDDILDQFNPSTAPKPSSSQNAPTAAQTAPPASGPGRPALSAQPSNQSEAEFVAQLQAEFEKTMANLGSPPSDAKEQASEITGMGKEIEEFTRNMEKQGLQPEDLLRAILGEEGIDPSKLPPAGSSDTKTDEGDKAGSASESKGSFDETIRKTLERMQASDSSARDADQSTSNSDEDILAQLMKAMESADSGGGGDDGDLSNLFLNMMHQLTSKDLLYEPMKELDDKFPDWLDKNREKLKSEDLQRYETQKIIVKEIVDKFEEKTYDDSNEKDRAFVWEKMQKMQAEGSPPDDLISAPFPGAFGPGSGEGQDPLGGCPTQ